MGRNAVETVLGAVVLVMAGMFIFFAYDSRFRHWHGIWHLFVMGGSLMHFVAVLRYVL